MFQNRQSAWEATGERQITLPLGVQEEMDAFKDRLYTHWTELHTPLTVGQILAIREQLGWKHDDIASVHRCVRAWLLTTSAFRRVGLDYWIPSEQLPPEVQHTRLQVPSARGSIGATDQSIPGGENLASDEKQNRKTYREEIIFRGTATKTQVVWTVTLLSIHQIE